MNKGVVAVLALVAAAVAGPAAAQDSGPSGVYLGGSLGYAQYKDTCKNLNIPCDGDDVGWRAFGGYQFNRNWHLEAGYADLGESVSSGPVGVGGTGTRTVHSYAVDLSGIGSFYLTQRLALFGRLGLYLGRTSVDDVYSAVPQFNDSHGNTNSGFTMGAGFSYTLGRFGLRTEWQRYDNIGTNTIGTDEVDVFSLSFLFRF